MKKTLMILLAALLLCLPLSAWAKGETTVPTDQPDEPVYDPLPESYLPLERRILGDWYGSYAGLTLIFTLAEDGSYALSAPGNTALTGSWFLQDGVVLLDGNEENTLLPIDGALRFDALGILLTREQPKAYVPAELVGETREGDFDGLWRARYVALGQGTVLAEALGDDAFVYIEGTNVALGGARFGNVIRVFAYENDALQLEEDGRTVTIELQEDGYLRLTDVEEVSETIYLAPAVIPGAEPQDQ